MWRGIATHKSTQLSENEPLLHASTSSMTNPGATSLILTVIVLAKKKSFYHKVFSRRHICVLPETHLKPAPRLFRFELKAAARWLRLRFFGGGKKNPRGREQNSTYLVRGERRTESTAAPHAQPSQPESSTNDSKKKKNNSERSRFILQDEGIGRGGAASIRAERLRGCDGVSSAAAWLQEWGSNYGTVRGGLGPQTSTYYRWSDPSIWPPL